MGEAGGWGGDRVGKVSLTVLLSLWSRNEWPCLQTPRSRLCHCADAEQFVPRPQDSSQV